MSTNFRESIIAVFVALLLMFVLVGKVIIWCGYPFAAIGSLFGDGDLLSFDEYEDMIRDVCI